MKNSFKKTDNQPDYKISFKDGESFVDAGGCWIKKTKTGNSYLSCKLGDIFVDHTDSTKSRDGFHITTDKPPVKLEEGEVSTDIIGF